MLCTAVERVFTRQSNKTGRHFRIAPVQTNEQGHHDTRTTRTLSPTVGNPAAGAAGAQVRRQGFDQAGEARSGQCRPPLAHGRHAGAEAMAIEAQRRREIQLQQIYSALSRVHNSDYGLCTACEEEIAIRRLETDPAAILCIACASRQEKR